MFRAAGLVWAAWTLAGLTAAQAKDLFVNNSGSPGCSDATTYAVNDAAHPWCTIGRAAWGGTDPSAAVAGQAAQAGDVVSIAAGTYETAGSRTTCASGARWAVALNPANSGTAGALITFRGIGAVRIRLAAGFAGPTIGADSRDYIVWDHVEIDEQVALGVSCGDTGPVVVHASTGSKIQNSTIRGTYSSWSDNYCGIRLEGTNNAVVANNEIYEFTGNWGHNNAAIMTYDAANTLIEHNYIHDSATGVFLKGDHAGDGWPQENNIVRFNRFEACSNKSLFTIAGNGSRIYQNVFALSGGFGFRHDGSDITDVAFVNNTLVNTSGTGAAGYSVSGVAPTVTGWRIANNIFHGTFGEAINLGDAASLGGQAFEHNVYSGFAAFGSVNGAQLTFATWQSTFNQDSASPAGSTSNPQFVSAADFHLQTGSPARTQGVDLLDLDGDASATDIIPAGAYITGSEVIGLVGTGGLNHTVTPVAGSHGSLSPSTPQSVADGASTSFVVIPDSGYRVDTVTGCGGALVGSTYTTGVITASCTVSATFVPLCLDVDGDGYGAPGSTACANTGADCDDTTSGATIHPDASEVCGNNVDEDCDSNPDDGCACTPGETRACYGGAIATRDVGPCHGGTQSCTSGTWGECSGQVLPSAELCDDAQDADCDGEVGGGDGVSCAGSSIDAGCSCRNGGSELLYVLWALVACLRWRSARRLITGIGSRS